MSRAGALLALTVTLLAALDVARAQGDAESSLRVERAKRAAAARNYAKAGRLLNSALAANPNRSDLYVLRATVHGQVGEHAAAIALMRRAARRFPKDPEVLTALGIQLMLGNHADDGERVLTDVVRRWPKRWEARIVLARHLLTRAQWRRAVQSYEAYFATRPRSAAGEDTRHKASLARAYLYAGRIAESQRLYRALLSADPNSDSARIGLFWATAAADCRQARRMFPAMAALEPAYPSVLLVRGQCELELGLLDAAAATARAYRQRNATSARGYALVGDVHAARGDLPRAKLALAKAVDRAPAEPRYTFRLARVERALGDNRGAIARLRAAPPPPRLKQAWTEELAEALLADRQHTAVRDLLTPWLAAHPDSVAPRVVLGIAQLELGEVEAAIDHLDRALALNPHQQRARAPLIRALNRTAIARLEASELAAAEKRLLRAARVGESPTTWLNLGIVRIRAGRAPTALRPLAKAARARPDHPTTRRVYARALALAGDRPAARAQLVRAGKLAHDEASVAEIALETAAFELDGGSGDRALAALDPALAATKDTALRQKLVAAYATAARASARRALRTGAFHNALRTLRSADRRLAGSPPSPHTSAVRCDLALAATGARKPKVALVALRKLRGASCPFAAPLDRLAVPILTAWNQGVAPERFAAATARLAQLRRDASGNARALIEAAERDLTLRAARRAYTNNDLRAARTILQELRAGAKRDPMVVHNLAVLEVAAGRFSSAIAKLRSVRAVPEAHVNLGIAYDAKGQPERALDHYRKAHNAGVRFAPLAEWIGIKERLWAPAGGQP